VKETLREFATNELLIPKTFVVATERKQCYSRNTKTKKETWVILTIDEDYLRDSKILIQISNLKEKGHLYVYGRKSFGVDWDVVMEILYSNPPNNCFFCHEPLVNDHGKKRRDVATKDHLVAREILKAFGLYSIPDNTVPCCVECNRAKGSLDPYMWRVKLKTLIKSNTDYDWKWKRGLKVMNKILLESKDPSI
jgi:hypothetical protein